MVGDAVSGGVKSIMMKKLSAVLFGAVLAAAPAFAAGEARTMFLGDSITHLGFCEYYLQLVENLRHPGSGVRYYNAGFGGGTLQTGIANCKHEIERIRPSRVVVMFGMNDIGWTAFETNEVIRAERKEVADKSLSAYRENYLRLLSEIRGLGVTNIVLATPTPYDEYSWASPAVKRRNVNEYGLKGMSNIVRETAREGSLLCVDLNAPMTEMAARHPEIAWCGGDRVHPGRLGYLFMAMQYLAAFGEMRPVASVALTADGKIASCENAKVDGVAKSEDGLSFVYRPQALPFPSLPEYEQLKSLDPKVRKLNCETLAVKGLQEGTWRLSADGRELGTFTARQFADGVNLAELDTPNRRIAAKAAEAMTALRDFDQPRRDRACVRRKYESFGVPMNDKKALKDAVDKYLAKLKAEKYPWYDWEEGAAGKFLDAIGRDEEIQAEEERRYRAMADVRPVAVRIEIRKVVSKELP